MGQYWIPVNLDKHEYVHPHKLGAGMKLGEQVGTFPGTGAALLILTAAMRERRGGGDLDWDSNYYGPERTTQSGSAEVVEEYNAIAKRTIGRWAGDRIAIVGDYAEDSDLPAEFKASEIYGKCHAGEEDAWTDVTDDVSKVIEHECVGKFQGDGWRQFKRTGGELYFLSDENAELVAEALEAVHPGDLKRESTARRLAAEIRSDLSETA